MAAAVGAIVVAFGLVGSVVHAEPGTPAASSDVSTLGSLVGPDESDAGAGTVDLGPDAGAPLGPLPLANAVAVSRRGSWKCSGVLVAPTLVLSARHCAPADVVLAGNDVHEPARAAAIVKSETPENGAVDLVLFKLSTSLPFTPFAIRGSKDRAPPTGFVRLVGFGTNVVGGGGGRKRVFDLNVFGWGCDLGRAQRLGCTPDAEMVIGWRSGKDTCDGDSGGPVFESTGDGFRLIAITSRAVLDAFQRCGSGGVYTRIDAHAEWLSAAKRRLGGE